MNETIQLQSQYWMLSPQYTTLLYQWPTWLTIIQTLLNPSVTGCNPFAFLKQICRYKKRLRTKQLHTFTQVIISQGVFHFPVFKKSPPEFPASIFSPPQVPRPSVRVPRPSMRVPRLPMRVPRPYESSHVQFPSHFLFYLC